MVELRGPQEALLQGGVSKVKKIVQKALQEKMEPKEILEQGLIKGMDVIGRKFKNNEISLPKVPLISQAVYGELELLQLELSKF